MLEVSSYQYLPFILGRQKKLFAAGGKRHDRSAQSMINSNFLECPLEIRVRKERDDMVLGYDTKLELRT